MKTDKANNIDYRWFIIRTQPRQEKKLADLLVKRQADEKNILEVYCPTHTTVNVARGKKIEPAPLFTGMVFVLATQQAVKEFMERHYTEGTIIYNHRKKGTRTSLMTVPEEQMRQFKDFNENYSDQMVILERPFSDYAFNPKTNEPNDIVRVIDGPLAGKEGYITKFRRDKRLVFHMRGFGQNKDMAVSISNIWNFHVVRLHNAENDRQTIGTMKERASDLLIGMLQGCGYGEQALPMLYDIIERLVIKDSIASLCNELGKHGHGRLADKLANINAEEARLILNLIRYERDNPGYVRSNWNKLVIRPFLTPTPGVEMAEGQDEVLLRHKSFTEIIRKVGITEEAYYPSKEEGETITTTYYAHIGMKQEEDNAGFTLFANWDAFLSEYFMTGGKANEKLVRGVDTLCEGISNGKETKANLPGSFFNYAPTLYKVLVGEGSKVKAVKGMTVGINSLDVMAITTAPNVEEAKDELINTCIEICKEINSTTHLAVWRRYLRTVWLHE